MNRILNNRFSDQSEKAFTIKLINNKNIQRYVLNNLEIDYSEDIKFSKCGPYINRIYPDVKITRKNKILALIECKRGDINVTDYVRGIGQLFQYEYFFENNFIEQNNQNLAYDENFKTVYFFPSDVLLNNDFNITKFKYPKSTQILQINPKNYIVRDFTEEQKRKFAGVSENLIAISEYYFRDNRIFELYILLKHLNKFYLGKKTPLNRKNLEVDELRQYGTPNNNNWRNAFITLSGLGLINKKNNISMAGKDIIESSYYKFCTKIYYEYIEPYALEIIPILNKDPNISLTNLNKEIRKNYENKEILFLTESENRYLSSWLNIFRDDFGFIEYQSGKIKKINYSPLKMTKKNLETNVRRFSKAEKLANYEF